MKYLLATLLLLPFATHAAAAPDLLPQRVRHAVQARMKDGTYPALVIAVVAGGRSRVYAYGTVHGGKAPDAGTVFEIGSVTKTFTATLLAQDILAGRVRPDEPVAKLLPGFKLPSRGGKAITLENLAAQYSGLPRLPSNLAPKRMDDPYADYGADKLKAFLAGYTLQHDPGSVYAYSNLGVGLLGFALARKAGMPYPELLGKRIFGPLGMHSSATRVDARMRAHLAIGHDATGKPVANWNFQALAGAGAIKSTARDMLRYLQANMGLLHSSLGKAMQLAHRPRASLPDKNERIGLVWMTRHDPDGDVVWHNGMTGGYASFLGFCADGSRGVVVLTNIQQSVDDIGFATLLADAPLAAAHKSVQLPEKLLESYTGSYRLAPGFILTISRDGKQLYARATGQGAIPIFASARDEFFARVADIRISFTRGTDDTIDGLVLHQNGDHRAPRLGTAEADTESGRHTVTLKPATLAGYVGRYKLNANMDFDVTLEHGQLMVRLGQQPSYPVYASAKDRFFYRVVDAQLTFQRGTDGKVDALVLHQGGVDMRAPRIGK